MTIDLNFRNNNTVDLTVVIITYNRYRCLSRLLRFYERAQVNFKFLILDSSDKAPKNISELLPESLDIHYLKFPPEIFFAEKISQGSAKIETTYAVLSADDDFLMPRGLLDAMDFLKKTPSYTSAHGRYFNHSLVNITKKVYGIGLSPLYQTGLCNEDCDPFKRVNSYLSGESVYYPMYAVHRTKDFQMIWKSTSDHISDWGLSELYPSALSLIMGKSKVQNTFYCSREPNDFDWCNHQRQFSMYSPIKVECAILGLARHLAESRKISFSAAAIPLQKYFDDYIRRTFVKGASKNPSKFFKLLIKLRALLQIRPRIQLILNKLGFRLFAQFQKGKVDSIYFKEALADQKNVEYMIFTTPVSIEVASSRQRY